MAPKIPTAAERLKALTLDGRDDMVAKNVKADKKGEIVVFDNLKKEGEIKPKKGRGGARVGSGRKTKEETLITKGIKQWVDSHVNEDQTVTIKDEKSGKEIEVSKPRVVIALEKLFLIGTRGAGDADALNKWLDRALGKPVQQVAGDEDKPIVLRIDF